MFNKKISDHLQKTWAAIGVGAVSIGVGVVKDIKANKASKEAMAQVKPYKTPQAVYDVLNATQYNAQSGFDPATLNYLTNQSDNAFAGTLGVAERLSADPNALSSIFGQKINGIMEISGQNHQLQMQNFSAYLNALNVVGSNDAAEQKSRQDQLKDVLQKISQDKADATQQIGQGVNAGISAYSNYEIAKLLSDGKTPPPQTYRTTNTTGYVPPPVTTNSAALRMAGATIG